MDLVAGPFVIVALVLAVGGAFKVADPGPTRTMFATIGLPDSRIWARASGVVEIVAGLVAIVVGGRLGGAVVAAAFVAFSVVSARLVHLSSSTSCGCFGRHSTPATGVHVAANAVAAAVGVIALVVGVPSLARTLEAQPAAGAPFVALVALGTWLFVAVLTLLPATVVAARVARRPSPVCESSTWFPVHPPIAETT